MAKTIEALEAENKLLRDALLGKYGVISGIEVIEKCLEKATKADPEDAPFPLVGADAVRWHDAQANAYRHALEMLSADCLRESLKGLAQTPADELLSSAEEESTPARFSVIGHDEFTRELFVEHVDANDGLHAFAVAAGRRPEAEFSVALPGALKVGDAGLTFPGESLVSSATIEEQPDVFGVVEPEEESAAPSM